MENGSVTAQPADRTQKHQLSKLIAPDQIQSLCPIKYLYDYLPHPIKWLKTQPISLSRLFSNPEDRKSALMHHLTRDGDSISLNTQAAMLPLHTGLEEFRQNKHWQTNEKAARDLLELFTQDGCCSKLILSDGRSMSNLAEEQLGSAVLNTYSRFSVYMFAKADQSRMHLLAECVILIFIFDGEPDPESIDLK